MPAADIFRNVSSGNSGSTTTSNSQVTVTAPTGLVTGDELLVIITLRTAIAQASFPSPTGWTTLNFITGTGNGMFFRATFGTDVTGSSWVWDSTDTTTANKVAWACMALKGVTYDNVGNAQLRPTSGTATPSPTITTVNTDYLVAMAGDRNAGSTWSWDTGWALEVQSAASGTNAPSVTTAIDDTGSPYAAGNYSVTATSSGSGANGWCGIYAYKASGGGASVTKQHHNPNRARYRATLL